MSKDEEMAARGRMLTEYGEMQRKVATLQGEAKRIGSYLEKLGQQLQGDPSKVQFEAENDLPTQVKICDLLTDLMRATGRRRMLEDDVRALGIAVDHRDMGDVI